MNAFLIPSSWELLSLFCKLSLYAGVASIAGGSLFLVLYSDGSRKTTNSVLLYCGLGALVGFQGAGISFLAQVGQINDSGPIGMFDLPMSKMLLDTQLGDVTLYRLLGFGLAFATSVYGFFKVQKFTTAPGQSFYRRLFTVNCFALMGLAMSFRLLGHVSVLSTVAQLAIAIHVLAFAFWIGILYPFYVLAGVPDKGLIQTKLKLFGHHAVLLLVLLIAAGSFLLWELLHSWSEFLESAYGLSIVLKLTLVLLIIGIAALNKLRLVPGLNTGDGARRFRQSVKLEALVALLILMVTAYFSTIIGPMQMGH